MAAVNAGPRMRRSTWVLLGLIVFGLAFVLMATWLGQQGRVSYRVEPRPPLAGAAAGSVMILGTWLPRLPDAATGAPAGALSDAALRALLDGRPAAARELLEGRLDPGSTDGLAWFYLGIARDQGADRPGAADAYARAARLLPDDPDARFRHARCLFGAGDAWGARPHISAVVNLARNWPAAQRLMGDVAFAIGDTIRAKRAYLDLLQIEPDDAYAEAMVLRIDGTPP